MTRPDAILSGAGSRREEDLDVSSSGRAGGGQDAAIDTRRQTVEGSATCLWPLYYVHMELNPVSPERRRLGIVPSFGMQPGGYRAIGGKRFSGR